MGSCWPSGFKKGPESVLGNIFSNFLSNLDVFCGEFDVFVSQKEDKKFTLSVLLHYLLGVLRAAWPQKASPEVLDHIFSNFC